MQYVGQYHIAIAVQTNLAEAEKFITLQCMCVHACVCAYVL